MTAIVMWEWEIVVVGILVWYLMSMMKMKMTMTESHVDGYATIRLVTGAMMVHSLSHSVIAVLEWL
jgi:hypothetical protein